MALCPILNQKCVKKECEWWHKWEKTCVINTIPERITFAENEVTAVYNALVDKKTKK